MADEPFGANRVGNIGVIMGLAYLLLLSVLMFYSLVKVWPHSTPSGQTGTTASQSQTTNSAAASQDEWTSLSLFWGLWNPSLGDETRLLLIVILAGMFGGLMHSLRSFFWYIGNRELRWSWMIMYVLLPLGGGILAMLFYFVIRGGFFSPSSTAKETSPFAFAGFAGLVGMFSPQAIEKLKQIATTVFAGAQQGKDHVNPTSVPTIVSVSPATGPPAGGTAITIVGTEFQANAKVLVGGSQAAVSSITSTSISISSPARPAGVADIEVTNPDGGTASRQGAFTYV